MVMGENLVLLKCESNHIHHKNKIKCHDLVQIKIMLKINKLNVYKFSVVNIKHEGWKLKDLKRNMFKNFYF